MLTEENVYYEKLSNGLDVYILIDPSTSLISAKTYVRAGSVDEAPFLGSGMSHYLEHLVAGGPTTQRTEADYKTLIAKLGGSYNAYTTSNHTCYYLNTIPEYTSEALHILHEWMFCNAFTDKEFEREREVITREIERDKVNLGSQFYKLMQQGFYTIHPARYPVIGHLENFKSITADQLRAYYKTRYIPGNIALVIGGNFNPEALMPQIRETFGKVPEQAQPPEVYVDEPHFSSPKKILKAAATNVTHWGIRFPTVSLMSADLYPLDLLDYVLGNGESSLLHAVLVEEKKLAYAIATSSYTPTNGGGYFEINAQTEERHLKSLEKEVRAVLTELKTTLISTKRLAISKKQKIAQDILSTDTIEDKVERIGQGIIYANDPSFYTYYTKKFKHVTAQDLQRVAQIYLDFDKSLTVTMVPETPTTNAPSTTSTGVLPRKVPTYHILKNGLRILLYPDATKPAVLVKAFMMGGIRAESHDNNGLGYLMTHTWGKQSARYTKPRVQDLVEGNGAEISGSLGNNTFSYTLECLSQDFKRLWPLYIDAILHPVFDPEDVAQEKRKQLKRIQQRPDDWLTLSSYHFRKTFFGSHPYGLPSVGETRSVTALTPEAVATHYRESLDPAQSVVTIFGDFDPDTMLAQCKDLLEGLSVPPPKPHLSIPTVSHLTPNRVSTTIPQDVAALFIGYDGLPFSAVQKRRQLELLGAILTGGLGPSGRIFNGLRDRGLVYMANGSHIGGLDCGIFNFYALTTSPQLAEVEDFILSQIKDIQQNGANPDECELALSELRYYAKERISTWDNLATITATDTLYGLGYDTFVKEEAALQQLTAQDAQVIAQELMVHPQIFTFERKPK